jgi:hypothetical protein
VSAVNSGEIGRTIKANAGEVRIERSQGRHRAATVAPCPLARGLHACFG